MSKYWLILIIALVFIAGCTNTGIPQITVQEDKQVENPKDALVIKDILTLPKPPIFPEQPVTLLFIIENKDEKKEVSNVYVHVFDPVNFKTPSGSPFGIIVPADCGVPGYVGPVGGCTLYPGEQRQITIPMIAPSVEDIANVKLETDLKFQVFYTFNGSTVFEIPVVRMEEVLMRQRAGETLNIERRNIVGSGPMQAEVDLLDPGFMIPGEDSRLVIKFLDKGGSQGFLKDSKIPRFSTAPLKGIGIRIPKAVAENVSFPSGKFDCWDTGTDWACFNNVDINLFKGESSEYLILVNKVKDPGVPFRTFTMTITTIYDYELREKVNVVVNPFGA